MKKKPGRKKQYKETIQMNVRIGCEEDRAKIRQVEKKLLAKHKKAFVFEMNR